DAGGDQPHGGLDGRLFREAETREQRAKIADVLGRILTIETDLMQGAPRACFGCACQQGLELGLGHAELLVRLRRRHSGSPGESGFGSRLCRWPLRLRHRPRTAW